MYSFTSALKISQYQIMIGKAQVPVRKSVKLIGYLCIENVKNIRHIANNK